MNKRFWVFLIASLFLVGFGQCAWIQEAGALASLCGYALFWMAMLQLPRAKSKFLLAALWFMAVHAIQLSWMTSTAYMGYMILGVYFILLLFLGLQFGLISLSLQKKLTPLHCLAAAGGFVLLEWTRLYLFTGFPWNPAGLALASSRYSIQLAAFLGIYGLSFWVIWTNLAALAFFLNPSRQRAVLWATLALFPYGYGALHEAFIVRSHTPKMHFGAALVNTGIRVEEKNKDRKTPFSFIPPHMQWERVMQWLSKAEEPLHLIVLPEAAFPYGMEPCCTLEVFKGVWESYFGKESARDFPPLQAPFAKQRASSWLVGNAFFLQSLANHFSADLIAGLDYDQVEQYTNAAFLFRPDSVHVERYDKRILVPVGEYIPFRNMQWVNDFLAENFGIKDSFDAGMEAKVFQSHMPIGTPICLEEIYSSLVRDLRNKGAELLVGLSNDVWFPSSRLARQHFEHARLRAVENGIFFLRASNMGFTGGIDCFGAPMNLKTNEGVVYLSVPIFSFPTFYSFWGDSLILCVSAAALLAFLLKKKLQRNRLLG